MTANYFPTASVIVVGYNSRCFLEQCLGSLRQQEYPASYEILFVDNVSTDGSADYVRAEFPDIRVIENTENNGYAGGNNLGAQNARGTVLAFLNPDTCTEPDWLQELVRPLVMDSTVGLTTSKIILADQPDTVNTCGNDLSLTGITTCHRAGERVAAVTTDEDVTAVSGAAFAIWTDLFKWLGGFDERFWMYLEDTDLSWRARLAGYRCRLAANSIVAHHYTLTLTPNKTQVIERNRYLMLAKNLNGGAFVALMPQLVIGEILTWGWATLRGPRFLWAKLLATIWLLTHLVDLWRARHAIRHLRRMPDGVVLRQHLATPPVDSISAGLMGRAAAGVLVPLAILTANVALLMIGTGPSDMTDTSMADEELESIRVTGD